LHSCPIGIRTINKAKKTLSTTGENYENLSISNFSISVSSKRKKLFYLKHFILFSSIFLFSREKIESCPKSSDSKRACKRHFMQQVQGAKKSKRSGKTFQSTKLLNKCKERDE
jgi:hypothetical protein